VLRYDDRGGGESTGDYSSATSLDFVSDAIAAVNYLMTRKEIDKKKVGVAGHSEGGLIAPMAANRNRNISFIVLMAGTGLRGDKLLLKQYELISRAEGESEEKIGEGLKTSKTIYEMIMNEPDTAVLRTRITEFLKNEYAKLSDEEKRQTSDSELAIKRQVGQLLSPWFLYFIKYDPYPELKKVKIPVLAINGEKDLQVPPKENLALIEKALKDGGNRNFVTRELPGLNHLFQTAETGAITEYLKIDETFSPKAMSIISDWILDITKSSK